MKVLKCDFCDSIKNVISYNFETGEFQPCAAGGKSTEINIWVDMCTVHAMNIFKYVAFLLRKTESKEHNEFIEYMKKQILENEKK